MLEFVSATEILKELPKLSPEEINQIFFCAADLREQMIKASPDLLAAIDEADASFAKEGGFPIEQVEAMVKAWTTK
jgi:hypothetical protein